jgi:heterodisulfide reductase subunit D
MIMEAIPGLKITEMPRNREYSRCCGAGGGLKAGYPDIQNKMAQRRVREAEETGAECLVSCCPFCFQGLNVGITAIESQLMMKDMSSLVAESLLGYDVFEKASEGSAPKAKSKEKAFATSHKSQSGVLKAVTPINSDDTQAARKTERERKRAERRATRHQPPSPEPDAASTDTKATEAVAIVPEVPDRPDENYDAKAVKKAERERKRTARRAAREKEKADRRAARDQRGS